MMAAPPQLDAIEESPFKGCALLGSPVLDEHEDNKFELFRARIDAADTAYELALEQSRFESRVEARRRASASARASAESPQRGACPTRRDYFARQRLEDALAGVKDLVGDVPDAVDDGLTPRSSLRRACDDAAAFLAEQEPALPSPGPRETDHSPPRTRTPARTEEEAAGDESDGSEDSGDGILAADYEGPGANRRDNVRRRPGAGGRRGRRLLRLVVFRRGAGAGAARRRRRHLHRLGVVGDGRGRVGAAFPGGGLRGALPRQGSQSIATAHNRVAGRRGDRVRVESGRRTRPRGVVLLRLRAGDRERRGAGWQLRGEFAGPRGRRAGSARPGARTGPVPRAVDAAPRTTAAPARRGALPAEDSRELPA